MTQEKFGDTQIKIVFSAMKDGVEIVEKSQTVIGFFLSNLARDHSEEIKQALQKGELDAAKIMSQEQKEVDEMLEACSVILRRFLRIKLREWAIAELAKGKLAMTISRVARFFPKPWRYEAEGHRESGPCVKDARGNIICVLFWPLHLADQTQEAEAAADDLGKLIAEL